MNIYALDMRNETNVSDETWIEVYNILDVVSDEVREETISNGDILLFEGWCIDCFTDLINGGIENENSFIEYAIEKTDIIIGEEWEPQMAKEGYKIIEGGYKPGGLYGVTWALFRRYSLTLLK